MPHEVVRIVIPRWWQPALVATAALLLADTARYLRRDDWISPNAEGPEGMVIALCIYAVLTGLPAFLAYAAALRHRRSLPLATLASAAGASLGVSLLTGVSALAGGMRLPLYAAIAIGCAAIVIAWAVLAVRTARPGVLTAAFAGALAAGVVALPAFQHLFLFDDDRALNVVTATALYALVTLAAVLLAGRGLATGRAAAVAVVLVLAARVPAAIEGLAQVGDTPPAEIASESRPNLLLVVSDSLRADYCSVNGGPVSTPWLERMAVRGAHFERAYSLAPWSLPATIGLFSSAFPPGYDAIDTQDDSFQHAFAHTIPPSQRTLAERLQHEGYETAAFVGNALLDRHTGILRGFEATRTRATDWTYTHTRGGVLARAPLLHDAAAVLVPSLAPERRIDTTGILTGNARAWLARRKDDRPFFLYVHYEDPHAPYTPPTAYRLSRFGWPYDAEPPLGDHLSRALDADQLALVAGYAGEIRYVDASASRLLEGAGIRASNTLVVFTADHGEEFWDHGGVQHGHTLYQELIHVPLLITGPGVVEQRIAESVSHLDLMPTLAGLLAIRPEPAWRGQDLAPWLRGEAQPDYLPPIFVRGTTLRGAGGALQAVVAGAYKRIRSEEGAQGWLFDLDSDPGELVNLEEALASTARTLDDRLDGWAALLPSSHR